MNPFEKFATWYAEAQRPDIQDPSEMSLATATPDGVPSVRVVLLKDFDERGFVFYTNLHSQKARELTANPRASLNFRWAPLQRQVRIEGRVEPVTAAEADAYFASRPRGSQIGAWASDQSAPLANREDLVRRVAEVEAKYAGSSVPRPPHWSGFRLIPARIEFWTGKESRLHERELFTRSGKDWHLGLLNP